MFNWIELNKIITQVMKKTVLFIKTKQKKCQMAKVRSTDIQKV